MTPLRLRPMTADAFGPWRDANARHYAESHVRAGTIPAEGAGEWGLAQFDRLLPDGLETRDHHLLTAWVDHDAVGSLWLNLPEGSERAFVYDVEIHEAHRGRGLGRAIMLAAEDYVRPLGARILALHVFADNTAAKGLYESLGYATTSLNMAKDL